jgi:hypothetical protein
MTSRLHISNSPPGVRRDDVLDDAEIRWTVFIQRVNSCPKRRLPRPRALDAMADPVFTELMQRIRNHSTKSSLD